MTTSPPLPVADGRVVSLHFTLRDEQAQVLDSSRDGEPLLYLHGADNLLPALSRQLEGRTAGEVFQAVIPPNEAYGDPTGSPPRAVPKDAFPDDFPFEPGIGLSIDGPEGEPLDLFVVGVEGDMVHLTTEHPLAGMTLHFDVEVLGVRPATQDELAHGHPHGEDGHEGH